VISHANVVNKPESM